MSLYYDTSALVKLVITEAESNALLAWRRRRPGRTTVSSTLALVELPRAVRRHGEQAVTLAREQIRRIDLVTLTDGLLSDAGDIAPSELRSLDAIHLVSAQACGSALEALVTYDHRMIAAAQALRLPVAHPGMAG